MVSTILESEDFPNFQLKNFPDIFIRVTIWVSFLDKMSL